MNSSIRTLLESWISTTSADCAFARSTDTVCLGSEKCLVVYPNSSFIDARAEFLKNPSKLDGLPWELKEKRGVGLE